MKKTIVLHGILSVAKAECGFVVTYGKEEDTILGYMAYKYPGKNEHSVAELIRHFDRLDMDGTELHLFANEITCRAEMAKIKRMMTVPSTTGKKADRIN